MVCLPRRANVVVWTHKGSDVWHVLKTQTAPLTVFYSYKLTRKETHTITQTNTRRDDDNRSSRCARPAWCELPYLAHMHHTQPLNEKVLAHA